jgi:hypothetical protein
MVGLKVRGSRMAKKKPKGAGEWGPRKPFALQVRGDSAWKSWVERLAKHDRASVSDLVDRALASYARSVYFTDPAPPR